MKRAIPCLLLSTVFLLVGAGTGFAQTESDEPPPEATDDERPGRSYGFLEAAGSFGFQFGEQTYVPDGEPGTSKHPITNGFGANVTAGYEFLDGLAVILDYDFAQADSRSGDLDNVLTRVEGKVKYHTLTAGVRSSRWIGIGKLYGELAVGVVFPFDTVLVFDYAPEMSAVGVMGRGRRIDNYNAGVGAHGELGYQFSLTNGFYLTTALRIQGFQSNNDGESTEFDNFVTDVTDPVPVTTEIRYDSDDAETPQTYSVQDVRLHLSVGYWF